MKKNTLALTLSMIITLSSNAHALELLVVRNYKEAETKELWKKTKTDQVPEALLARENIQGPDSAYASIFPKTFLQESTFAVCHKSCSDGDIFSVRNGEIDNRDQTNWNVLEQSNVYFWLKKYFSYLDQSLNFRTEHFLKVTTNRELRDETKGKKLTNNAFFNPKDISLSFLPATKSILFKLFGGKINRSGYDASVIAHETSHYLFFHLFPNALNEEIDGLNEGFADYFANGFLNNPKVGLVMMQGEALRDSSAQIDRAGKLKMYEAGMEAHDLGERVAYALWKTRELSRDKAEMDRLVIDAVADLGKNPYSTVHDFKQKMLERIPQVIDETQIMNAKVIWEMAFAGSPARIQHTAFLEKPSRSKPLIGFRQKQVLPERLAKEYGTEAVTESNFSLYQIEKISETQGAILIGNEEQGIAPHWVVIDTERANILGIYTKEKKLLTEQSELDVVKDLPKEAKTAASLMKEFSEKVQSFSQLVMGKGDLAISYKVKNQTSSLEKINFNGAATDAQRIHVELKRKFLTGVLLGAPEIESIELLTIAANVAEMPELNGQRVIGYKLQLKTGTSMEVIMDKFPVK